MLTPSLQIIFIVVVGTLCQVVGWRFKIPSILLLLLCGIAAGPVYGLIEPNKLFGGLLNPLIELAVALILFEGGLTLSKAELGQVGSVVFRLVFGASLITWILLATSAHFILGLSNQTALLFGAILVISGPTVVIPLLRLIRVRAPIEPILRWEGIIIDPIGVILAVLAAEVFESGILLSTPLIIATGILTSLIVGVSLGWIGATFIRLTIGKHRVPDHFIVPITLATLFSLTALANLLHEQAGLITSTSMGLLIAMSHKQWVETVEDFLSHIQRILIAILFITLAAKLEAHYINEFSPSLCVFIAVAIFIVRPAAVFLTTFKTTLTLKEKLCLSALAPRGIVSAALASTLGGSVALSASSDIQSIVPYTFAMIISTVAFYAIVTPIIFRVLGVQKEAAEGVLFMGGGRFSYSFGTVLSEAGFNVAFVDTNQSNIRRIRKAGLPCIKGNILSESIQEDLDLDGIGHLIACTSNEEANSLAAVEFQAIFDSSRVFQIAPEDEDHGKLGGRIFCSKKLNLDVIDELWGEGFRPYLNEGVLEHEGTDCYVLADIENKKLLIRSAGNNLKNSKTTAQVIFGLPPKKSKNS